MKVFQQPTLNTRALDSDHQRVGSVSPLKYRPNLDMDGLQEEDMYQRVHNVYDRARLNTPEKQSQYSPHKSARSERSGRSLSRGNERWHRRSSHQRSILKSSKSNNNLEPFSDHKNEDENIRPFGMKNQVSFADLGQRRQPAVA